MRRLEAAGVLREITGYARNRRFRYDEYVRIFSEDAAPEDAAPSGGAPADVAPPATGA